jgi:hypothetical protein
MLARDVEEFIAHGADVILGKPLKISILCSAINEHFKDSVPRNWNWKHTANSDYRETIFILHDWVNEKDETFTMSEQVNIERKQRWDQAIENESVNEENWKWSGRK